MSGYGALALAVGLTFTGLAPLQAMDAESGIHELLTRYEQAIEAQDIEQFRAVMPTLSTEDQERLERSFQSIREHRVEIDVVSIQVEGSRARVQIKRRDTLNPGTAGEMVSAFPQTLEVAGDGTSWHIESIVK